MKSYPYSNPFETDSFLLQNCYTGGIIFPDKYISLFFSPHTQDLCDSVRGLLCVMAAIAARGDECCIMLGAFPSPTPKFQVSTREQKPQESQDSRRQHAREKDLEKKSICIGHLKPVFLQIKMHVQLKALQFHRIEEIAQAKLENAVCSAVGESVYIKHMNSVLPLRTASIFMSNSCFSLSVY